MGGTQIFVKQATMFPEDPMSAAQPFFAQMNSMDSNRENERTLGRRKLSHKSKTTYIDRDGNSSAGSSRNKSREKK